MEKLEHLGVSALRTFDSGTLAKLTRPIVLCYHAQPLAVLVPYALYLAAQDARHTPDEEDAPTETLREA